MKRLIVMTTLAVLICSGCAVVFMPKNQKVTVSANKDSKIFINNELQGKGSATVKLKKDGMKQVVVQTPGYKDNYYIMVPSMRQPGYWVCIAGDIIVPLYGWCAITFDLAVPKGHAYPKDSKFQVTGKINTKTSSDKFIHISNIGVDLKDKDVVTYRVYLNNSDASGKKIEKAIEEAETKKQQQDDKAAKKKLKKKEIEKLKEEEDAIKYDDTKFSDNLYTTLKNSGFVDTINQVFRDDNNTMTLEGKITKINLYGISYKRNPYQDYFKAKVFLTWYIKNQYGESLDSINTHDLSGDFLLAKSYFYRTDDKQQKQVEKMIGDAINNSYLNLYNSGTFKKYLHSEPVVANSDPLLQLNRPQAVVVDKSDAAQASVIIKRDDKGHGSGFAITQDGYILTNYHVIASKDPSKPVKLTVITANGDELEPKIVRFNKAKDVALLKVDKPFEKAFVLSNTKQFKNLQDVFTIGAPKSIELGQTVTSGMISNERKSNNNELLQLSMAVNFGNSGGPIFDNTGALHGVVVGKLVGESTEGISFAIPAYKVGDYINISY